MPTDYENFQAVCREIDQVDSLMSDIREAGSTKVSAGNKSVELLTLGQLRMERQALSQRRERLRRKLAGASPNTRVIRYSDA